MDPIAQRFNKYFGSKYQVEPPIISATEMSVLYKGIQKDTQAIVAIKILKPQMGALDESIERFYLEGRTLRHLNHPNLIKVYDVDGNNDMHFMVLEYIDGINLRQLIWDRGGPLPLDEGFIIIKQINSALGYIHEQGKIHRDIKSSNIMIEKGGRAVLLDFGIARDTRLERRLTVKGTVLGTIGYMSPEQTTGNYNIDHRSDIYSIGVVLYEMFTGWLPFQAKTAMETIDLIQNCQPIPPNEYNVQLSPAVASVILRSLEKDPQIRYQTIEAQTSALEKAIGVGSIEPDKKVAIRGAKSLNITFKALSSIIAIFWLIYIVFSQQDPYTKLIISLSLILFGALSFLLWQVFSSAKNKVRRLEAETSWCDFGDFTVPVTLDESVYLPGYFVILYGEHQGRFFRVPGANVGGVLRATMGRGFVDYPQSRYHIKVDDRDDLWFVSRDHLEISFDGRETTISNRSQVNPIFVDEHMIETYESAILFDHSIIQIGSLLFEYHLAVDGAEKL